MPVCVLSGIAFSNALLILSQSIGAFMIVSSLSPSLLSRSNRLLSASIFNCIIFHHHVYYIVLQRFLEVPFSSANDKCEIAKRGRNKQKRNDLRQYSLALITTKESGLPLCSHIYERNKNDQTDFFEYIGILKKRIPDYNPQNITLVFDGGSNNKKNFEALDTHYICSFSLSYCKELYAIDLSMYVSVTINNNPAKCFRLT